MIIESEPEPTRNNNEHDYYNNASDNEVDVEEKNEWVQLDHTYCLPANFKVNGNVTILPKEPHVKLLKIMDKNGKAVILSGLKINIDLNEYKINIPVEKFKCVLEVLPFLFRRLPLITNLADTINYKCRYPYVAKTLNEFCSWNIGRRRSSEVSMLVFILEKRPFYI